MPSRIQYDVAQVTDSLPWGYGATKVIIGFTGFTGQLAAGDPMTGPEGGPEIQ